MLDVIQNLVLNADFQSVFSNFIVIKLSGGAHIYQLVVTRRIVGDFIYKVILRIAE